MPTAGELYDSIFLNVEVGAGFAEAHEAIDTLIRRIERVNSTRAVVNVDTRQIDAAINKLRGLQTGGAAATQPAPAPSGYGKGLLVSPRTHLEYQARRVAEESYLDSAIRSAGATKKGGVGGRRAVDKEFTDIARSAEKVAPPIKEISKATSTMTNSLSAATTAARNASINLEAIRVSGGNTKEALASATVAQNNLKTAMANTTSAGKANIKNVEKANRAMRRLGQQIDATRGKTSAYALTWKNMTQVMGKVAFWTVATGSVFGLVRAFKSMVDTVVQVDYAMAGIAKITGETVAELKPLRNELIRLSIDLGGNTTAVMEAATAWARLGYRGSEISKLMRTSMLAMNIAELTAAESTRYLTAAMIQFDIELENSEAILDSWNELSNRTAATTRDLGESVARAGKTFETTGDNIHYVNALTATLVQTMARSGEEVGTALRTIGAHIYRPKTITAIEEKGGVEVRGRGEQGEVTGELRSQSEILTELASKWNTFSDAQKTSLAQSIAGTRRYQYFFNIMENYDLVIENLLISLDSLGSAERENAIFMDTLQKKTDQLKAAFTKLYVATGDAGIAGALKWLVESLTKVVDKTSSLNITVPILTMAALGLWKIIVKITRSAGGLRAGLTKLGQSFVGVEGAILAVGAALTALESAAAYARRQVEQLIDSTNTWVDGFNQQEEAARGAAEAIAQVTEYESLLEQISDPDKRADAEERINKIKEDRIQILAKELGISEEYVEKLVDSGDIQERINDLEQENENLIKSRLRYYEDLESRSGHIETILKNWGKATEEERSEVIDLIGEVENLGDTSRGLGGEAIEEMGRQWEFTKEHGPVAFGKEVAGLAKANWSGELADAFDPTYLLHKWMHAKDVLGATLGVLRDTMSDRNQRELGDLGKEFENLDYTASGAAKKIDLLAKFMDELHERLRASRRELSEIEHRFVMYRTALDGLEAVYGDHAVTLEVYRNTHQNMISDIYNEVRAREENLAVLAQGRDELWATKDAMLAAGTANKEFLDQIEQLDDQIHGVREELAGFNNELQEEADTIMGKLLPALEKAAGIEMGRERLHMVLPSKKQAKEFNDEFYRMANKLDDIVRTANNLPEELGQGRAQVLSMNTLLNIQNMSYEDMILLLDQMNLKGEARKEAEATILALYSEQIKYAEKLNDEFYDLSKTFQNIIDEGLWGIITGEQTALELAKQIGEEYGKIALQTITQPATERFAAGMGGAAYFMQHGELPPAMKGGIMDVALTPEGAVPVKDIALEAALSSGQLGNAVAGAMATGAGGGVTMGPMPADGGGKDWGTMLMPAASGAISGAMMGAGGGAAGAGFGATMGAIGGAVSLIPGWGEIAGAGISLLGFLGSLFGGGPKYTEEDPYARQQQQGMGERSVQIGSAGTVHNSIHMTIYYESVSDAENVARLYDLLEKEGVDRGYQTTGSASSTPV